MFGIVEPLSNGETGDRGKTRDRYFLCLCFAQILRLLRFLSQRNKVFWRLPPTLHVRQQIGATGFHSCNQLSRHGQAPPSQELLPVLCPPATVPTVLPVTTFPP